MKILLLGGGHAHCTAIRDVLRPAWARKNSLLKEVEVTLVNETSVSYYSGMVPGMIAGVYEKADCSLDLTHLCSPFFKFIAAHVAKIDLEAKEVTLGDGSLLEYDLLSINLGSVTSEVDITTDGIPQLNTKPFGPLLAQLEEWDATPPESLLVLGGGAAGVELSCSLTKRYPELPLHLVTEGERLLNRWPLGASSAAHSLLLRSGVNIYLQDRVRSILDGRCTLSSGRELPISHLLLCTGSSPPPLLKESRLPVDDHGYIPVDSTFEVLGYQGVFAAGDCAALSIGGQERSGVHAVRAGKPLGRNILASLRGHRPRVFVPPNHSLSILGTLDAKALIRYGDLYSHGRAWWWLKRAIDLSYVKSFKNL